MAEIRVGDKMNRYKQILSNLTLILLITLLAACTTTQPRPMEYVASVSSADGSAITYGVKGQGDTTLVFIHCWTCNHEFWRSQVETFSQDYQVVWLDLAGHGLSRSNRDSYTMQAFGQDVAAVVHKVGAERVVLVGHSMGGPVALEAAELLGDKVTGIVGVDTVYTPFQYPQTEEDIAA